MRLIKLSEAEKERLEYLYRTSDNLVVRRRSQSLLLSNDKHSMKSICRITKVGRTSLYYFFNAWEHSGEEDRFTTLSIAPGRGAKVKLESVKELLPEMIKEHNRNLNPVLDELASKYNITVCKATLQSFLKDAGL